MIDRILNHDDMLHEVKRWIFAAGSQKKAAKALGISEQYMTDVVKGRREVGPTLANALGYDKVIMYTPKTKIEPPCQLRTGGAGLIRCTF